jgi:GntR family phosphonate transport system transcriptional regulator
MEHSKKERQAMTHDTVPVAHRELERGNGVALWRQIQAVLEHDLRSGYVAAGEKLPTERQLAQRFGVNRHTVRQALAELARKELIVVEQGRGAFARRDKLDYALARRVRFSENLLRQSRIPSERLLGSDKVQAGRKAAEALQVLPATMLLRLRTLGNADGRPLCCTTHYFPYGRFAGFAAVYGQLHSVTAAFRALGVADYVRTSTRITSRMPDAAEVRALGLARQTPVLVVESVNADGAGTPVEYGVCVWAADRIQFVIDAAENVCGGTGG